MIDEGSLIPRPSVITRGNKTVKIGTPVYVHTGYDVIIDCNIVNGTLPITIQWFHNGSPDSTRRNVSTITITDASNDDVFQCRADNIAGFDTESTVVYVEYGKYPLMYLYIHITLMHKPVCMCVGLCVHMCMYISYSIYLITWYNCNFWRCTSSSYVCGFTATALQLSSGCMLDLTPVQMYLLYHQGHTQDFSNFQGDLVSNSCIFIKTIYTMQLFTLLY